MAIPQQCGGVIMRKNYLYLLDNLNSLAILPVWFEVAPRRLRILASRKPCIQAFTISIHVNEILILQIRHIS